MPQTVLITGASSGIGAALAERYARDGAILGLIGRDETRLEMTCSTCVDAGAAAVETMVVDVRNRDALRKRIGEFDRRFPIDVLIANAGVTGGTTPEGLPEPDEDSYNLFEINVLGVVNTVHSVLPGMLQRRAGQIAIMSSLAAFVPLADSPSYSASKSAVLAYGLALREAFAKHGIRVSAICPGYVDTPLSRRLTADKPFLQDTRRAADVIHGGLRRNCRIVAFPTLFAFVTRLIALLPTALTRRTTPTFFVRPPE